MNPISLNVSLPEGIKLGNIYLNLYFQCTLYVINDCCTKLFKTILRGCTYCLLYSMQQNTAQNCLKSLTVVTLFLTSHAKTNSHIKILKFKKKIKIYFYQGFNVIVVCLVYTYNCRFKFIKGMLLHHFILLQETLTLVKGFYFLVFLLRKCIRILPLDVFQLLMYCSLEYGTNCDKTDILH